MAHHAASTPVMLIAGGTGSIGKEIAAQAIMAGWAVIIQGRSDTSVTKVREALLERHPEASVQCVAIDIHIENSEEQLVKQAAALYQRLDAVVDCLATGPADGGITGPFSGTATKNYTAFLDTSVAYLQRLTYAALPWLKKSRGCLIAFISDAAIYPAPNQTIIGAARSATIGFIRNFAAEVARDGLRAHCISPSFVLDTKTADRLADVSPGRIEKAQQKAGLGLPTPADIAPLVVFLCSDQAKKMTGQIISINGGLNT